MVLPCISFKKNSSLQAVCDTWIARVTGCVSSLRISMVGDSPWNYSVACTRVNRVMLVNLYAETIKPVFEGDKI